MEIFKLELKIASLKQFLKYKTFCRLNTFRSFNQPMIVFNGGLGFLIYYQLFYFY